MSAPTPPTLAQLLDDAALYSLEHQIHLSEVLGEHSWEVDLREPRFTFTGATPRTCSAFHLLGSAAPGPRSWLWSWANPSGYPDAIVGLAAHARRFGEQNGVAELATAEVPFDTLLPDAEPFMIAGRLTDAVKAVSGRWTSYQGDAGGGTRAAFLVEHPDFALPAPDGARVMRILQQGIAELVLTDHRRAIYSYGRHRGLEPHFGPDGTLALTGPGLTATVSFDGLNRVAGIDGTVSAAG